MTSFSDKLDEVLLKPYEWQLDDYRLAKEQIVKIVDELVIGADLPEKFHCDVCVVEQNLKERQRKKLLTREEKAL